MTLAFLLQQAGSQTSARNVITCRACENISLRPIQLSDSAVLRWGLRITLLTGSQGMLMLLVQEFHFENHCISIVLDQ